MSVVAAAVVGSAVVGAYSSHQASKAQTKAASSALGFEERKYYDQVALGEEHQQAWDDLYGDIEANLAKSIGNISARGYEVAGHTHLEQQYSDASRRIKENYASRGLAESGAEAAGQTQLVSDLARGKASVSSESERQALSDKLGGFMSLGLSQKPGVQQLPSSTGITTAGTQLGAAQAQGIKDTSSALTSGAGQAYQLYAGGDGSGAGVSITGSPQTTNDYFGSNTGSDWMGV